jgi:1,4-alpha-glucan branching enzyme
MGQDVAQYPEWDEKVQRNWELCDEPLNHDMQSFVHDLLHMYSKYPAMYELDDYWEGFSWVNADDNTRSIFSFIRRDRTKKNSLLFVVNMTPVDRPDFMVGAPCKGRYTLILDENGEVNTKADKKRIYTAVKGECDGQPYRVEYPLPGYGCAVFRFNDVPEKPEKK